MNQRQISLGHNPKDVMESCKAEVSHGQNLLWQIENIGMSKK
jgi:hypothetical protein